MKKIVSTCLVLVMLLTIMCCSFGCAVGTLEVKEAKEYFKESLARSLASEIYYWKELDNRTKNATKTTFNKYCLLDKKDNIIKDENGRNKDFGVQYSKVATDYYLQTICGTSIAKADKSKIKKQMLFEDYDATIDGKEEKHKTAKEMTVEQYLEQDEIKNLYLPEKLLDLSLLKSEDIVFEGSYDTRSKLIKLVTLKFKIVDSFFTNFKATYGRESVLKGKGISVEIAYDRLTMVTVYDELKLDEKLSIDSEVYRLDVAYIGPIVRVPDFSSLDKNKNKVWTVIE
ncbi:MAG: hypothetical protein RR123_03085 [Clostridia bacterium]